MKYTLLLLVLLGTTCASQEVQPTKKNTLERQLKKGRAVLIENTTFEEIVDFTKMLPENPISTGMYQVQTSSSITFQNCTFKKPVLAYRQKTETHVVRTAFLSNVSFLNCEFEDAVSFRAAEVHGLLNFAGSIFKKKASFEELSVYQNAYFTNGNFREEARFHNVFFLQKADFLKTAFDKICSFQSSIFNGQAQFSDCHFTGYADLSLTQFRDHAFFNYARFRDKAIFNEAYFARSLDFLSTQNVHTEFKNATFGGQTRFFKSEVEKILNFENSIFQLEKPDLTFLPPEKVKSGK